MNIGKNLTFLEKISFRLAGWIGSPFSLFLHTVFIVGIFVLRYLGVISNTIPLALATAVSLEAIYLAIFIHMAVNRNTKSITVLESDIRMIQEEEKEAHKLMINIFHLAHQMKTLQQDVEALKKSGVFKRSNGNGHRVQA